MEKFRCALGDYEEKHPNWRAEALLWVIDYALRYLKLCLESKRKSGITWNSPFVELEYPVEMDWGAWGNGDAVHVVLKSGVLSIADTANAEIATKALARIMVKHLSILAMQDLTNHVAFEKNGDRHLPVLPGEAVACLDTLKRKREKRLFMESLFKPFSMGAAPVEFDFSRLKPNARVPRRIVNEIVRATQMIDLQPLKWTGHVNGQPVEISLIFQVHPLTVDVTSRRAFFPLTVGLMFLSGDATQAQSAPNTEHWPCPPTWNPEDREGFWNGIFEGLKYLLKNIAQPISTELDKAVVTVSAKLEMPIARSDTNARARIMQQMLESFAKNGEVLQMDCQVACSQQGTADFDVPALNTFIKQVEIAATANAKGRALEDLLSALFQSVPGFQVSQRQRTQTEEIDLLVENNSQEGWLKGEGSLILVECKNWQSKCGKDQFVTFREKILSRRGRCKLGFLVSWNGFAETVTKEMLRGSREEPLVVPVDGDRIREAVRAASFLQVLKETWLSALKT